MNVLKNKTYTFFDFFTLAFTVSPIWSCVLLLIRAISAIFPTIGIIITAGLVDTVLGIFDGRLPTSAAYSFLLAQCVIVGYGWIVGDLTALVQRRMFLSARTKFRQGIIDKSAKLKYRYVEDQSAYDIITRVTDNCEVRVVNQFAQFIGLMVIVVKVAGLLAVLMANIWWAGLIIFTFSTPLFYFGIKAGRREYSAGIDMSKVDRRVDYLSEILTDRETSDERTLFGFSSKIGEDFWKQFEFSRKHRQKFERKSFFFIKIGGALTAILSFFVAIVLFQPVVSGLITVGLFISLINACNNLASQLSWGISSSLKQLASNREYLKDLTKFCALEEADGATDLPSKCAMSLSSIEFRNVRFKYPGTDVYVLNGISFRLEKGGHYSFVGQNGSGKTTLIKLLTAQYDDFEGEVLINGESIKKHSPSNLKSLFAVAYQDFSRYSISIKNNIALGNINDMENLQKIEEAVSLISLTETIERLPKGFNTPLNKVMKDGVDISGGQWQKIALARLAINPSEVKILDEPTASLDPISESVVYNNFKEISRGATTIFISHRLGSTKLSDRIFVFSEGQVVEQGSHSELMNIKGKYHEMYNNQLEWYTNNNSEVVK